jgi:tetratricopeptide (TPR) repeat protein
MMKKLVVGILAVALLTGCASSREERARIKEERESYQNPFYLKYLDPNSRLDQHIYARIESLRLNRNDPVVHNELGALLFQRDFPKDAMEEFDKALDLDGDFYPAWFNKGLVYLSQDKLRSAEKSFRKAVRLKPGFAEAQFHLGLVYEMQGRRTAAIDQYAKAFAINWQLLDPRVNPRIIDSELRARALMELYSKEHAAAAARFTGPHPDYFFEAPAPDEETVEELAEPAAAEEAAPKP